MEDVKNPAEHSLDNDKSQAVDITDSEKSEDKPDQVDETPLGTVPEASAFMNEQEMASWNQTKEEVKVEKADQAEGRPTAEVKQQSADQEPKEPKASSLLVKRLADSITDEDFKSWDHDLVLVFKARDAKKRAKIALR